MGNVASITGYVCNLKKYNNDDGSIKLLFAVSCKTQDPKRWSDNKERDFWNIDLYISSSRAKLADYIQDGKLLSVGGVPYKSFSEDKNGNKKEWAHIRASADMIQLLPSGNRDGQQDGSGEQQKAQGQSQGSPEPQRPTEQAQGW